MTAEILDLKYKRGIDIVRLLWRDTYDMASIPCNRYFDDRREAQDFWEFLEKFGVNSWIEKASCFRGPEWLIDHIRMIARIL